MEQQKTNWAQFIPLATVFFFWGFVAASNDILIPVFKQTFSLSQVESQLVSLAFYIAYTVGSLLYLLISYLSKGDLINRIGYKNSLALGLGISALGTLLFYPAANLQSFPLMLSGLFIVALGFSLQQTVANPLAIALGPISTGSQRLTMAGGINNFGTTIGPLIVSFAITDFIIGFHYVILFTWGSVFFIGLVSQHFLKNRLYRIFGSLFGAFLFYIITNFGVWSLGSYGYTFNGLILSYTLAVPFFMHSLISTFIFSAIIETVYKFYNLKVKNIN